MAFAVTSSITTTTVQGGKYDSADSSDIVTCGQCLPIMEGDDAMIGVRLYRTSLPAEEYMALVDEIFTPFYSTQPGFVSYTGAATQDPDIVMFVSIYDTEENSAAAWDKSKSIVYKSDPDDNELLNIYYGRITWTGDDITGTTDNCVKSFDVGDYLSSRLFDNAGNNQYRPPASGVSDKYTAWTAVESFDSYTASVGMGEFVDESFYFETFNNKEDSADANALSLQDSTKGPIISLRYTTVGQVVFDSTCSDDYPVADTSEESSEESSECETVADIIKSNPHLGHFADLYEVATNAEDYYMYANTWTVFAPTDEAFENTGLAIDAVSDYSAIRLLVFHEVFNQTLTTSDLNCDAGDNLIVMGSKQATRTICSKGQPIGQKGGGNDGPALFVGDEIVGCDGVVQIIDQVLLPPSTVHWYPGLDLD